MQNIHLEPLGGGIEIFVSDSYHFSTDTILLADFANRRTAKRRVDLGTGCGTIPMLWLKENRELEIAAVELQSDACRLLEKTAEYNKIGHNLKILNCNLRELKGRLSMGYYDLVACNPPYKQEGSGISNPSLKKQLARHETECSLNDVCAAAAGLLQFGGRLCVCQRPERLADAMEAMRANGIEPKTLRMVQQRMSKAPKLFLLEGRRGGKRGFLEVMSTLFIEDESGDFSAEMLKIYGDYKSVHL